MTWILVKEQTRLASASTDKSDHTTNRHFVAQSDTPTNPLAATIASAGGTTIPIINETHPTDGGYRVIRIRASPEEEAPATVFRVEVEYSNQGVDGANDPDPLSRPDTTSWEFDTYKQKYFIDKSATPKPVVNSAGDPFEDLLERDAGHLSVVITRNVPLSGAGAYSPAVAIAYKDVVNSASFTLDGITIDVGQAKIRAYVGGEQKKENGTDYRTVQWHIDFRDDWDDKIADRGFNELDADGKHKSIPKATPPVKVDKPYPLDGTGHKKALPTDTPEELTFRPYDRSSFATFGFS